MCVKLSPGDLNPGPCLPHPTSIYSCGVTTAPRVCGGMKTMERNFDLTLIVLTNGMKTKIHPIDEFQSYLGDTIHHDLIQRFFFFFGLFILKL